MDMEFLVSRPSRAADAFRGTGLFAQKARRCDRSAFGTSAPGHEHRSARDIEHASVGSALPHAEPDALGTLWAAGDVHRRVGLSVHAEVLPGTRKPDTDPRVRGSARR